MLTGDGYLVPHNTQNMGVGNLAADREHLQLETRYNYEALRAGSLWTAYGFEVGDKVRLSATPLVSGVFGKNAWSAHGFEMSLAYKQVELSTEDEFVFDADDSEGNFFYRWTELSYAHRDRFRFGLVAQRTKVYHTGPDTQRGFFVGSSHKQIDFTAYVFIAGWTDPALVF